MTTHQHDRTRVIMLAALIILWGIMHAEYVNGSTFAETAHGNRVTGADRSYIDGVGAPYGTEIPKGHCGHCHEPPGSCDRIFNLFMDNYGENMNDLCYACHDTFDFGFGPGYGRYGFYQGKDRYINSTHNTDEDMEWPSFPPPGPAYMDHGNCNNCHTPHGYNDGSGVIPRMLFARDSKTGDSPDHEMGCYACHGDNPAPGTYNIKAEAGKEHRHPIGDYDDRHRVDESGTVGFGPDNRHAECVDCHNPHTIGGIMPETNTIHYRGPTFPRTGAGQMIYGGGAIYGSDCLQGVWGVLPTQWNSLGGPSLHGWTEWKPPTYPNGAEYEAQICLKCHSPYGGASRDIAAEINPHNNSGHPIARTQNESGYQLSGRPPLGMGFGSPWADAGNTRMYCTDCHGNDAGVRPEGVHGSSKPSMLRAEPGTDRHYWIKTDLEQWFRLNTRSQQWHIDKLFCLNCHAVGNNTGHETSAHSGYACTHCHASQIHGGWNYGQRLTIFNSGLWMVGQPCHPVCGK